MSSQRKKILKTPLLIAVAFIFSPLLFKLMHWPFSIPMQLLGYTLLAVLYPIRFWKKTPKFTKDYIKLILVLILSIDGFWYSFSIPFGNPFAGILEAIVGIAFFAWLMAEGIDFFVKEKNPLQKQPTNYIGIAVFSFAGLLTVIGVVFKIMHWPYASILLTTGIVVGILWVLKDVFLKSEK